MGKSNINLRDSAPARLLSVDLSNAFQRRWINLSLPFSLSGVQFMFNQNQKAAIRDVHQTLGREGERLGLVSSFPFLSMYLQNVRYFKGVNTVDNNWLSKVFQKSMVMAVCTLHSTPISKGNHILNII